MYNGEMMQYKRSIEFGPSITLSTVQTWNATVSYPGSGKEPVYFRNEPIIELREHILANFPEYIDVE